MATPTEINLVNSASVTWSAGSPYPDPNNPQNYVRDVTATAIATPVNWRGAWSSGATYAIGDAVSLSGSSYLCISANTNQSPPNATYWAVLSAASGVSIAGDLGGTTSSPEVVGIQGVGVSATAPTNGQVLEYDSGSGLYVPTTPSAGGGSPFFTSTVNYGNGAETTSAYALKGNFITALQAITVSQMFATIYGNSGDEYGACILNVSGTTITGLAATSDTYTFGSTTTGAIIFTFASPFTLTAGNQYVFAIQLLNRTTTTACQIDDSASNALCPGLAEITTYARIAAISPTSGTLLTGTPPYNISIIGSK